MHDLNATVLLFESKQYEQFEKVINELLALKDGDKTFQLSKRIFSMNTKPANRVALTLMELASKLENSQALLQLADFYLRQVSKIMALLVTP
ncbi:MAG TPA: hypothetical protein VFD05_02940 [Bacilli bacterium]|nr:hypothetical protein [Bacilli bacterium]